MLHVLHLHAFQYASIRLLEAGELLVHLGFVFLVETDTLVHGEDRSAEELLWQARLRRARGRAGRRGGLKPYASAIPIEPAGAHARRLALAQTGRAVARVDMQDARWRWRWEDLKSFSPGR